MGCTIPSDGEKIPDLFEGANGIPHFVAIHIIGFQVGWMGRRTGNF